MFTHLLLPKKHVSRLPRFAVALVLMLMLLGVAGSSQAQVYYLTNDATSGSASSTDGIFRMGYDGSSATALGASLTNSPTLLQVDLPNNRAFVYEAFSSSPPTNLAIKVVNLTSGALITTIPLALTGRIQSIKYDPINDYIYYVVQDSAPTTASTTNDALIRVKPDGTGSTTLITGFCTNPSFLALDITHNRVFVYQNLFSDHSFKVLTLSGNSATLTASLPTATVPAPMVGVDCEYDPVTDYIYFLTSDNAAGATATANDALYKMHPDGTGQTTIKSSVIPSPQYQFALDAGNNRAFLIDNSSAEKAIYSVNLTDGTTTKVKTVFSSGTTSLTTGVWVAARAILTTTAASNISSGTVTLGGNITRSDASVTERGVVYSSSNTTPTTADSKVSSGSGNGSFTVNASGLNPATTYYVRAYAISAAGTSYGNVQTFTTLSNDASLSALSTSSGSLSPAFTSGTVAYNVAVTNATTSITVTPTRTNANATIKVNGNAVASGTASGSINLSVGDNIITVVGLAQDGTTTKTYTLTVNRAKFQQVITFASLPSKTYGNADFAPGATLNSSLIISYSSDNASVATIVNGNIHIVGAGTANITASQAGDASNLAATNVTQVLTVNKAPVTVTANAVSKTYGDADPSLTYAITSGALVGSDTFTGTLTRNAGTNAGAYAINQGSLALSNNYALSFTSADLTINKRVISVQPAAASKTYGDADPAFSYTSDALSFGDTFSGGLTRDAGESVGTYAINQGSLTLSSNYTISFTGANFSIIKKTINVAANAATKVYGDADPVFTYTADALVNTDSFSGSLTRNAGETPGDYAITQGSLALSNNYTISYTGNNLTIGKRALTVNADLVNKQFGDADPVLTYTVIGSLVNGDAFSGSLTRQAGESIGSYAIQKGSLTAGAYYDITFNTNDLVIGKRSVVVNITPASKFYGDPDPVFAYTINSGSLLSGDHFTGAFTRVAGETGAQNYGITQGTFAINNPDYTLSVTPSTLTINQAPLTVTVDNKTKKQGEVNPVFTFSYSGFKNGEGPANLVSQPQATTTAGTNSPAGDYPIYAGYVASPNYAATYVDGVLTILPVSNDATLSNIALAGLSLSPAFDSATTYYEADAGDASSVIITPTVHEAHATITINGDAVTSGSAKTYSLYGGTNYFQVNVTAEDGTTTTGYQVLVSKNRAVDANLTSISVGGTPIAGFDPNVTTYALSVPNTTSSVVISSVLSDPNGFATILVNNVPLEGGASTPANLIEGDNVIKVRVRAENPSVTKTYTLNIHRAESTNVTDLNSLTLNPNSVLIRGGVTDANINYSTSVASDVANVTITAVAKDPLSVIKVNGVVTASGVASAPIALSGASTSIVVAVTARDGVTRRTYTTVVKKNGSNNANATIQTSLSSIVVKTSQEGYQYNYTTSVDANATSINIIPKASNEDAIIKVNGQLVANNTASQPIALTTGQTTITTVVTAQDGVTVKTYILTVNRNGSNNNNLSTVRFSPVAIVSQQTNEAELANYTATVPGSVSSVTVQPVLQDPNAIVYVNGSLLAGGAVSEAIDLFSDRATPINIYVMAQDGTSGKLYIYSVVRNDDGVSSLTSIKLNPTSTIVKVATVGNTTSYTASVAADVNSVTLTPTAQVNTALIKVNGLTVANGTASDDIALNASGATIINTIVTSADGLSTKNYTLSVTKNGSSNANATIRLDPGSTLVTVQSTPGLVNYITSVDNSTTSVKLITTADADAIIKINGATVASGTPSAAIPLTADTTNITAVITAGDGLTTKTYTVAVTRQGSTNTNLSSLKFSPSVSATYINQVGNIAYYTVGVGSDVSSITLQPTLSDARATLSINGSPIASGAVSAPIALSTDHVTNISLVVVAPDGITTKTYLYSVTRNDAAIATISILRVSPVSTLVRVSGNSNETNYTTSVDEHVNSVIITPIALVSSTIITVNGVNVASGTASGSILLNPTGATVITIVGTAADGTATKRYTISVTKNGSSNPFLTNLSISAGVLSPNFTGGTVAYATAVGNEVTAIKFTPRANDTTSAITVSGVPVANGTASAEIALNEGDNVINTIVTAANGTVKTYTVTVTRAVGAPMLSLRSKQPDPVPATATGVVVHAAVSPNGDGLNDVLTIDGINSYPENKISIINSAGTEINQIKNYDNSVNVFDGRSKNGTLQKPGTYFYVLEYLDGKETKRKTGYIILKY